MATAANLVVAVIIMGAVAACVAARPTSPVVVEKTVVVKHVEAPKKKPAKADIEAEINRVEKQLRDLRDDLAKHP